MTGYAKILLTEVMPQVQKSYHVSANREERAIAGLSMGGAEALYTGLNNLDKFAWLGSFSGAFVMWPRGRQRRRHASRCSSSADAAPPRRRGASGRSRRAAVAGEAAAAAAQRSMTRSSRRTFPTLDAKANSRIKYMVIACGTADGLVGVNRQFKTWLKAKGVQFTEEEVPDMGHVWPLWRQNFADFVQKVFK